MLFLPLFGGWFDPATTGRFSAFQIGIAQEPAGTRASFSLFSFGLAGLIILVLLWRAAWRNRPRSMALLSACLVFLSFDFYLQLSVSRPGWLKLAIDGVNDFRSTMSFANAYSINTLFLAAPNAGITGLLPLNFPARIGITFDCLSYGWHAFTLLSVVALVASLHSVTQEPAQPAHSSLRAWVGAAVLIVAAQIFCPVLAQYDLERGDLAATHGNATAAESYYRRAISLDSWYRLEPIVYQKIGALHAGAGDKRAPEALLATGLDMIARGLYVDGMYRLDQAEVTDDFDLKNVVLDQIASAGIEQGQTDYAKGAQGIAQSEWQHALGARPGWMATYYMLGRADQDLGRYQAAREYYILTQKMASPKVIRAMCMSAIGDTYYLAGNTSVARDYYIKSLAISYAQNLRGMKSLLDDYYK